MASQWMVEQLRALVNDLAVYDDGQDITLEIADGYLWRMEWLYRELLAKEATEGLQQFEVEAMESIALAHSTMSGILESLRRTHDQPVFQAQIVCRGTVGRPRFKIQYEQLQFLLDSRFSVPQISNLLGVSVSTVRRRMSDFNLSVQATYSLIADADLDALVYNAHLNFPKWGVRQMYGYLLSQSVRVQFHRVQESLRHVDPEGSFLRQLRQLRRRKYCVPGPQSLWHIDGNHKLIRSAILK